LRHSWKHDSPRKGYSTCRNCDLEVKTYKIKKGGLPRCDPERALKAQKIDCKNHMQAAIAGTLYCWSCGKMYTKAEREAGRIIMQRILDGKPIEDSPNFFINKRSTINGY